MVNLLWSYYLLLHYALFSLAGCFDVFFFAFQVSPLGPLQSSQWVMDLERLHSKNCIIKLNGIGGNFLFEHVT
jgi:hypothetical protein